ncbi:uncharacterized protein N7482_005806 [Penicillium canariense]|uniref:Synaptobrevin n=1 Tax=Penicillium canariense TaxID=189055 RepID=A0A9W9I331_9EURO|nr:uncharacterized protein N7482_005806 [Penicillium canariense]KAJ5167025.1 hypothetical protein N7482_005806 [Penicillium canariense]
MAVSAFPSEDSPDLTLLNVARLFTRLEHNLLSPGSELHTLRKSELQRVRVAKNVDYARTLLSQLERSLPQLKPLDRRHEAQAEIARDRQLLKRMQSLLDEEEARAENDGDDAEDGEGGDEWKELFANSVAGETVVSPTGTQDRPVRIDKDARGEPEIEGAAPSSATFTPVTSTPTPAHTTTTAPAPTPASTIRKRNLPTNMQGTAEPAAAAKATGSITRPDHTLSSKEDALSAQRLEQEDLTGSLLSLASQLKASSQSFQATLGNEKSVLDRAVSGIDKTSSTMEAAGQRMGMLRRMTEGQGWWGRLMLYAWIFGLWVVAVLIVYVGPKLRF